MNTSKQKLYTVFIVLVDTIVLLLSYALGYWIQFGLKGIAAPFKLSMYWGPVALIVVGYLILNTCFGLYRPFKMTGRKKEAINIIKVNIIGALILAATFFALVNTERFSWLVGFSRMLIAIFVVTNTIVSILWRNIFRVMLLQVSGRMKRKSILMIGCSDAAVGYIERIMTHRQWGYDIIGILDDNLESGRLYHGVRVLGSLEELDGILAENTAESIVITLRLSEYSCLETIVKKCEKSGVHTEFVPDYSNIISTRPYTEDLLGLPLVHIRHVPLMESGNAFIKRVMDVAGSICAIIVFSPIMLGAAIAVKVSSPGPLIFKQERVGLHNRNFKMYKFRSMTVQPAAEEASKWTTKNDARVTTVGRFIRKTSIDELPQLFNVLKGDMSLVGPRPERPFFVEKFKEEIPRYMIKHQVRPGMTGWAQVNGLRGDTSIRKRIELDLYYIENWSVAFDIRILFLTVFRGFVNKNAY